MVCALEDTWMCVVKCRFYVEMRAVEAMDCWLVLEDGSAVPLKACELRVAVVLEPR